MDEATTSPYLYQPLEQSILIQAYVEGVVRGKEG